MITIPLNTYLIEINKAIAYMPMDHYIQEASLGPKGRFYVSRGSAGGISISEKNVTILACGVGFLEHDNHVTHTHKITNNNKDGKFQ